MKFGLLKSKIERCLVEAYTNDTIKRDLFVFDQLVAKNKNINKLYFLYDELSSNKGLNESVASDFINQSIVLYENTINKIQNSEIKDLELWVEDIKTQNNYQDIDNLFSNNVLTIENKIKSKKTILENLKKLDETKDDLKHISINEMVKIANKTVKNYLSSLSENEKRKLESILLESDEKLKLKYDIIKEDVIDKLMDLKSEETDNDVRYKIDETITKVKKEKYDKLNYFKLQELNRSI